jgi:pimeloyl-ACP methyl ester carboxylesterase
LLPEPCYLVDVQCEDRIRLHGLLQGSSAAKRTDPSDIDRDQPLWLVVHGVGGNFYSSSLLDSISLHLRNQGHSTLRINTRGHDQIAFAFGGWPYLVGAAYEIQSQAIHDLRAWFTFAIDEGFTSINIVGHSLGAVKAAYFARAMAKNRLHRFLPTRLVLVSPPRLNHQSLATDPKYGEGYLNDLAKAEAAVAANDGERLLEIKFPQPLVLSAATFVDKYGRSSSYDYLSWASEVPKADWIFGEFEVRGNRNNFADCDRYLAELVGADPNHTIQVIAKSDHNYTLGREQLNAAIV